MTEPETGQVAPHPVFKAMLICDQAIREEGTGKTSLIGIFEQIGARRFPVRHSSLAVYEVDSSSQSVLILSVGHRRDVCR
jgi:hypothetical protein